MLNVYIVSTYLVGVNLGMTCYKKKKRSLKLFCLFSGSSNYIIKYILWLSDRDLKYFILRIAFLKWAFLNLEQRNYTIRGCGYVNL